MSAVCYKCKQPISHRAVHALGKVWHPKHFTCSHCQKPIQGNTYNVINDEAVCSKCYQEHHVEHCCCCDKPILERVIHAIDGKWHENCFRCVNCGTSLVDKLYYEVNGCLFCEADFHAFFSARCAGCAKPIVENAIVALNTKWHCDCFKCSRCEQPITADKFAIQSGRPVCPKCAELQLTATAAAAAMHLKRIERAKDHHM